MIITYKKMMILFVACIVSLAIDVHACLTTFINDKGVRVIIYDKNDKAIIPVAKNEKRRFGSERKHAHFAIYVQQPKVRTLSRVYVCKQNECGGSGNIQLKFSDIENNTPVTQLFDIQKSEPYSSMVHNVSMMQKKGCNACGDE